MDAADTLGTDGRYVDPLWRVEVALTPLERALLRTWPVRRLAFVAHAGAAAVTTTQTYSRLEHSLGLLALVAHLAPDDEPARVSALLHDVGHAPFSHTLDGLGGIDHHVLSRAAVRDLDPLLRAHGTDAATVIALDEGPGPAPLVAPVGAIKLDHLDSFVRSGRAHGRTRRPPSDLLRRLTLVGGAVATDAGTAAELVDLVAGEARAQRAPSNVGPVAVLRDLVGRLIAPAASRPGGAVPVRRIAAMTDDELWATLLAEADTAEDARAFRADPAAWRVLPWAERADPADEGAGVLHHRVARGYLGMPLVDGALVASPEIGALGAALPLDFAVVPPGGRG